MTTYALAPNSKWAAGSANTPSAMLEAGQLAAYRVRGTGTLRHLDLVPLGSTARDAAEWVSDAIDFDGRSVQSVARELHVSTATVRRYLEALELTEEVEAGEWDDLHFGTDGSPVWEQGEASDELVGDIVDLLDNAPTVADLIEANSQGTDVAPRPARTRKARPTQTVQDVVAKQGLPWPTDAQRAAALADVKPTPAPATQPEPAPQGAALAMCFCAKGGPNAHTPGTGQCTNTPARRARSHG